jgi:hypothetical protein
VYYDFLTPTDDRYELYATEPDRGNILTRWGSVPLDESKPDKDGIAPPEWREMSSWRYDWIGAFFVVPNGVDRYFVTASGQVYQAPLAVKPGTPLIRVWDREPILALIHDADKGVYYAFTKGIYFVIGNSIKPLPHDIKLSQVRTAEEALESVVQCARIVRGLKIARMMQRNPASSVDSK